jgi:sugar phosphate permease
MASIAAGYALFLPIGLDSSYVVAMFPTFILAGLGFALAFGPLNVAATSGVIPEEQGLAGGLLNTSFQFGGALALAIVTAVINANAGAGASSQSTLDAFHAALFVSLGAALLGLTAMLRRAPRPAVDAVFEEELLEEAA